MATISEIIELAMDTVQDDSFEDRAVMFANKAIQTVAATLKLPALTRVDVVVELDADSFSVQMPDDFSRNLFMAYHSDGTRLDLFGESFIMFRRKHNYLSATGTRANVVAINGNTLFVCPKVSTAQTLYLSYQAKPTTLGEDDTITEIPEPFASELIEAFICKECFMRLEDGIEDRKTNTEYYERRWRLALAELNVFIGADDGEPQTIFDESEI